MHQSKGADFVKARTIAKATPAQCTIFDPRQLMLQNLVFYFRRQTRDVWDILAYYHHAKPGAPPPFTWADHAYDREPCVAIAGE